MQIKEITCKTACNKLRRKMPYGWDLNIYRGCSHSCIYCYAIYSHKYLGSSNYNNEIFVKTNIVEVLEKELSSPNRKREVINIGGVTDSYQAVEKNYKIMPEIIKLLIKHKTPCIISTKSDLILRDFDLIEELSQITYVNIASTITTTDENVRKIIEPNGVESQKRFNLLKEFSKTSASIGLHIMPIIPFVTDSFENIDTLFYNGKMSDVTYALPGVLYLRGETKNVFYSHIKKHLPEKLDLIREVVSGNKNKREEYKNDFYKMLNGIREKYGVSSSYSKPMKEKLSQNNLKYKNQPSLFSP